MDLNVFKGIVNKHGLCEVSYRKQRDPKFVTWAIVSADLSGDYIQSRLKGMKRKLKSNEVLLWNWRYDSPLVLNVDQVTKIKPLRLDKAEPL
tara:strand:- start:414 stop:689 length:276 start_codon:yes stop_codon:yes gene_type:complete